MVNLRSLIQIDHVSQGLRIYLFRGRFFALLFINAVMQVWSAFPHRHDCLLSSLYLLGLGGV